MKVLKTVLALGLAASLTGGLAACGTSTPYSGEGVVVEKDVDKPFKTAKKKKRSSSSTSRKTDYEIIVDVPGSDKNRTIDVTKAKYNSIKVGQTVEIQNNKIR